MDSAERAESDVAVGERMKSTAHKTSAWASEDTPSELLLTEQPVTH